MGVHEGRGRPGWPSATRIAATLVAIVLTVTGALKFIAYEHEAEAFHRWGYPAWFVYVVGAAELASAAGILWPRTSFYAACLGIAVMGGAIVTHLRVPEVGLIPLAAPLLLLCTFIAWQRRPRQPSRARRNEAST